MISYIEYMNLPTKWALCLVGFFFVLQIIGEILELKGKVVPEFLKIRKYFLRKRKEREIIAEMPDTLREVQKLLSDVRRHYDADNIRLRDQWIDSVNKHFKSNDDLIRELEKKLDRNNADTLSLLIDSKRNFIIDFASRVIDDNYPATREQFKRVFKIHEEYELLISDNGLTNGEVDIAHRIISESYEKRMRNHTFVEELRGYESA